MRKTLFYLFGVLFVCFPMTTFAQMSFHHLPKHRSAFGFAFDYQHVDNLFKNICGDLSFDIRTFRTNIDYGFNSTTKISFIPGVSFTDVNHSDVPPAPYAEIRFTNAGPLGTTTLDYFLIGGFGANYAQLHGACDTPLHLINIDLAGGIGLSHTLKTESGLVITPFFGAFYSNIWKNISMRQRILIDNTSGLFTGKTGVEIALTKSVDVIGIWHFSFEKPDGYFQIALNFH